MRLGGLRSVVDGGGVKVELSGVTGEWVGWVRWGCCRREDGTAAAARHTRTPALLCAYIYGVL